MSSTAPVRLLSRKVMQPSYRYGLCCFHLGALLTQFCSSITWDKDNWLAGMSVAGWKPALWILKTEYGPHIYTPSIALQSEITRQSRQTMDSVCLVNKKVTLSGDPIWRLPAFMKCYAAHCHQPALFHTPKSHNSAAALNVLLCNVGM